MLLYNKFEITWPSEKSHTNEKIGPAPERFLAEPLLCSNHRTPAINLPLGNYHSAQFLKKKNMKRSIIIPIQNKLQHPNRNPHYAER